MSIATPDTIVETEISIIETETFASQVASLMMMSTKKFSTFKNVLELHNITHAPNHVSIELLNQEILDRVRHHYHAALPAIPAEEALNEAVNHVMANHFGPTIALTLVDDETVIDNALF